MAILRTDIERALEEIIANEDDVRFQALAVVLAKQKWPDLIASERKKDGGLDARAPASVSEDRKGKGLACSITNTLAKVKGDSAETKNNFPDIEVFIFSTPRKVSKATRDSWAEAIGKEFGFQLEVISREDIITSLMMPENESLCGTLPGIQVTLDTPASEVASKVRDAVVEVARNWDARMRASQRPTIALVAAKLDNAGRETDETIDIAALWTALSQSRRITLEAPGGSGKTTTLIQLATQGNDGGSVAFLIDLPAWIQAGTDILEFIARAPAFRAGGVEADDIARLSAKAHVSFLLNGWNEITDAYSAKAVTMLAELERDFPAAGIIVATRNQYISPPLPGALRLKLLPLTRRQRSQYLRATLGERADELRIQLEASRVLDDLTRTPMILAEVVTIYQAGGPIPDTRIGVLGAVVRLVESSEQHRPQLQTLPVSGHAELYLEELAAQMTDRGEVLIVDPDARSTIQVTTAGLVAAHQIAAPADPTTVLRTLCAHHVLEQSEYPSPSFRFQHQQFQEYYAARFLLKTLAERVQRVNGGAAPSFAASYVDKPTWGEPLRMVAEEIRLGTESKVALTRPEELGIYLVRAALGIDPIFAGELSRLCGPMVWGAVRNSVGTVVRNWYAVRDARHQRLALAAMLATGSDDFADILVPLLTSEDRQIRVSTYDAGEVFYPSSLGSNWRSLVDNWSDEARADFVFEVIHRGLHADIGESFATTDFSPVVRRQAIQELCWIGATETLTRVVNGLDNPALEEALPAFYPEMIPDDLHPRLAAANRRLMLQDKTPLDRIRRLLHGIEFGDAGIATDLMTELNALVPPLDQHAAHAVSEAIKIASKRDRAWVSQWVVARLLDGSLWGDHWEPYVESMPPDQARELVEKVASRELEYRDMAGVRIVLSAAATAEIAAMVFVRLCEAQVVVPSDGQSLAWKQCDQLRDILRAMPPKAAVAGILSRLQEAFAADSFQAVMEIFGRVNADAEELRSALPDMQRNALRAYIKKGIGDVLKDNLFGESIRSHAAIALARIGDPEDMADIRRLIDADIARRKASPSPMSYSNWYVDALLRLEARNADEALIELLSDERYERDASGGLLRLAKPPGREKPWLGSAIDFSDVWSSREGMLPTGFDRARAKYYAQAIKDRIVVLKKESAAANNPQYFIGRIKHLAVIVAMLDGHEQSTFVIETLTPASQFDAYSRMSGMRALLLFGAQLTFDDMMTVLNPAIEYAISEGYRDQSVTLLVDCLELLPFSDDPSRALAHIEEVMGRFRYRPYQFRDVVTAVGHMRSEAAIPFLIRAAQVPSGLQNIQDAWIDALGRLGFPAARQALLSFIDPDIPALGVYITFDFGNADRYASYVADWARQDSKVRGRLLALGEKTLTPLQQRVLPMIYQELGTEDVMFAGANLLHSWISAFGMRRGFEPLFLERLPHGEADSYTLMSRNAVEARQKLFLIALHDPIRRQAALSILAQVEIWRLEYGRPPGEPRHPMVQSGEPWPPLSIMGPANKPAPTQCE